jgi:hypothetical protein
VNTKKFDELRDAARRKAQEFEDRFEIRRKVELGFNAAADAARKATEAVGDMASAARDQAATIDKDLGVTENVRAGARTAEEKAREVFGAAQTYYERAGQAYNVGTAGPRIAGATLSGYQKARDWIKNNPGKTAVVSLAFIGGVRAGSALPGLGVTILGAGGAQNWFFHSALPIVGIRKLTERYDAYLKAQEKRIAEGDTDEAEKARIEFQRNLTKYVGAPLLGAFSVAAGATMIASAFSGATVTGLPVSLLLGGNPLLNGIWFFANGVVCISEGYRFFMIALADQDEVQRVVREIKGLLPA